MTTRTYLKCPKCSSDQLYVQGRVSMPVFIDFDGTGTWDWDCAEIISNSEYVCYDCAFELTEGTVEDVIAMGEAE